MHNFLTTTIFTLLIGTLLIFTFLGKIRFNIFLLAAASLSVVFLFFRKIRSIIFNKFHNDFDKLEEEANIFSKTIEEKRNILSTLPLKYEKISSLFTVSGELIGLCEPETIFDFLSGTIKKLFPEADNTLLFVLPGDSNSLKLVRSLKKEEVVIKDKEGDIIDRWVLKNNYSLFIEDIIKEFRFDSNKIAAFAQRHMQSFILSPISVGEKMLGILRVESKKTGFFSLDDSRLLRSICDLGAVVLERANLFRVAEELAVKDPLTLLYLKDYFFKRLAEELTRAKIRQYRIGILMLDIDDFKNINDSNGHIVGDVVLKRIAQIIKQIVGDAGNVISRFGGEEFMILALECDKEKIIQMGENIRKTIEATTVNFRRKDIRFTVSLGAVVYPDDGDDIMSLVGTCDKLMYKAKQEGKNKLCFTQH